MLANAVTRIMATKRERIITLKETKGAFSLLGIGTEKYNFDGISSLRKLLSKERAKVLDAIKYQNPGSIYELSKLLKRPFKATFDDVRLLERFGFIELFERKVKGRTRKKPKITSDEVIIRIKI